MKGAKRLNIKCPVAQLRMIRCLNRIDDIKQDVPVEHDRRTTLRVRAKQITDKLDLSRRLCAKDY